MRLQDLKIEALVSRLRCWRESRTPRLGEVWATRDNDAFGDFPDHFVILTGIDPRKRKVRLSYLFPRSRNRPVANEVYGWWLLRNSYRKTTAKCDLATGNISDPDGVLIPPPANKRGLPWSEARA